MKHVRWIAALVGALAVLSVACDTTDPNTDPDDNTGGLTYQQRLTRDVDSLKVWIDERLDSLREVHNNPMLDYEEDTTGLLYMIYEEGTGGFAEDGDIAYTYYRGSLMDGVVFDQNLSGLPFNFTVGSSSGVIEGWDIGITKFKTGTKGYLFIPSPLAYGTRSLTGIPANSNLIFNMELVELR
ncbi:MAG: FKBP-type peptidyl-prolyl cis-trans isomerase [Bacteroidota bacterium]